MFDTGSSWLMTSLNPSPRLVSAVQIATTLPMFLLTLPAGALTDVVDPRRLLIAAQAGIETVVGDFSLTQLYTADELFVTGTMGGLTPVLSLDGRRVGTGHPGPVTTKLAALFSDLAATTGTPVC